MLPDPVALSAGNTQGKIDIPARIRCSVNPFRDPQFRIEKNENVRVREFSPGTADLDADGFKQRIDLVLRSSADRPAEWNIFALAVFRQGRVVVRWIEGKQENAKLPRIARRIGERGFQSIDGSETRTRAASVNRKQDQRITRKFGQVSRASEFVSPIDRLHRPPALRRKIDNVRAQSDGANQKKRKDSFHGFEVLIGVGRSGVYGGAPGKLLRSVCTIGGV